MARAQMGAQQRSASVTAARCACHPGTAEVLVRTYDKPDGCHKLFTYCSANPLHCLRCVVPHPGTMPAACSLQMASQPLRMRCKTRLLAARSPARPRSGGLWRWARPPLRCCRRCSAWAAPRCRCKSGRRCVLEAILANACPALRPILVFKLPVCLARRHTEAEMT